MRHFTEYDVQEGALPGVCSGFARPDVVFFGQKIWHFVLVIMPNI